MSHAPAGSSSPTSRREVGEDDLAAPHTRAVCALAREIPGASLPRQRCHLAPEAPETPETSPRPSPGLRKAYGAQWGPVEPTQRICSPLSVLSLKLVEISQGSPRTPYLRKVIALVANPQVSGNIGGHEIKGRDQVSQAAHNETGRGCGPLVTVLGKHVDSLKVSVYGDPRWLISEELRAEKRTLWASPRPGPREYDPLTNPEALVQVHHRVAPITPSRPTVTEPGTHIGDTVD